MNPQLTWIIAMRRYNSNALIAADLSNDATYAEMLLETFGGSVIGLQISRNGDGMNPKRRPVKHSAMWIYTPRPLPAAADGGAPRYGLVVTAEAASRSGPCQRRRAPFRFQIRCSASNRQSTTGCRRANQRAPDCRSRNIRKARGPCPLTR